MPIKFFDMFAGIGGFRSGLKAVGGFECVDFLQHFLCTDCSSQFLACGRGEVYRLNRSRQRQRCESLTIHKSFSAARTHTKHLYQYHESTADKKKLGSFCHSSVAV